MEKKKDFESMFEGTEVGTFKRGGVPVPAQTVFFDEWISLLEGMRDYLIEQGSEQAEFAVSFVNIAKTYSAPEDVPNVIFLMACARDTLTGWPGMMELWKVTQEILGAE